jgi:hypothetical protein
MHVDMTLDNNFIRELYQIRCLPKLKILSLGRNMIGLIPTNAFSELLLLKDLNLRHPIRQSFP